TKDTNLRIRADALGLTAEDYDTERVELSELYTGHTELLVPGEMVDQMYKPSAELEIPKQSDFAPNEYILLKDQANASHTALGGRRSRNAGHRGPPEAGGKGRRGAHPPGKKEQRPRNPPGADRQHKPGPHRRNGRNRKAAPPHPPRPPKDEGESPLQKPPRH